jgi:sulfur-carrier protein
MATVRIPGPLRTLSEGKSSVDVPAGTVAQAIEELERRFPGFRERVLDDQGNLRQFVNVYLNDEDVRFGQGLQTAVSEADEVSIIPAVAGGGDPPPGH